jgi:hypothetical protein
MSIGAQVVALVAAGKLFKYMPRTGRTAKRRLYLSVEAAKDLNNPSSATNLLVGKGGIVAALDRWVLGDLVYGTRRGEFLDRLRPPPPEVWEIRVTTPAIQARLFGRMAAPNTLILTKFHTRSYLGKRGSAAWVGAMNDCVKCWDALFPSCPPFSASDIHAYVTENCDDYPI